MIAVMHPSATAEDIDHVVEVLRLHNLKAQISTGEERTVIGVIGTGFPDDLLETLEVLPGVDRVTRITRPYKLASRDFKPANTVVEAGGRPVGGREFSEGRGVQAAVVPLCLSGPWCGRVEAAGRGPAADRAANHHRGHGTGPS